MKEKIKAILFWWEKKIIYDLKSITQQLALMKISEKHQESEKLKKNQTQTLSLNTSEILINQQELTEQNEKNDSKKYLLKKMKINTRQFCMKQKIFRHERKII